VFPSKKNICITREPTETNISDEEFRNYNQNTYKKFKDDLSKVEFPDEDP
jgi:hypothetical protein